MKAVGEPKITRPVAANENGRIEIRPFCSYEEESAGQTKCVSLPTRAALTGQ